jgi:hypothetical protein
VQIPLKKRRQPGSRSVAHGTLKSSYRNGLQRLPVCSPDSRAHVVGPPTQSFQAAGALARWHRNQSIFKIFPITLDLGPILPFPITGAAFVCDNSASHTQTGLFNRASPFFINWPSGMSIYRSKPATESERQHRSWLGTGLQAMVLGKVAPNQIASDRLLPPEHQSSNREEQASPRGGSWASSLSTASCSSVMGPSSLS